MEPRAECMLALIGATPKEIIFTSGATESNNLAIKGVAEMYREKGNHIITQVTEHKAVLDTCKRLEKNGCKVTYLPVQPDGLVSVDDVAAAITDKTILVSIMYAIAYMMLTRIVLSVIAAATSSTETRPSGWTGRYVTLQPFFSSRLQVSSTALCSVTWVMMWLPFSRYISATPLIARLLLSVAPLVKMISFGVAPISANMHSARGSIRACR